MRGDGLGLDAWWDEPVYRAAQGTFTERGAFIYREAIPDPANMTKCEWKVILRFLGARLDEIKDVQLRMGGVWR